MKGNVQEIQEKLAIPPHSREVAAVLNRLKGKRICIGGKFKYGSYGPLPALVGLATAQQGVVSEELDDKTDILVLSDLTSGITLQKQATAQNKKGATIQVLEAVVFQGLIEPTAAEVASLIRCGPTANSVFNAIFGAGLVRNHVLRGTQWFVITIAGETFDGMDLSGFDFMHVEFVKCGFVRCKLSRSKFTSTIECDFSDATGESCLFGDVTASRFRKAQLPLTSFNGNLTNADFTSAGLDQTRFFRGHHRTVIPAAIGCVFTASRLHKATFDAIRLTAPDFDGADLSNTAFAGGSFESATFRKGILHNVSFIASGLTNANFSNADCTAGNFADSDLTDARFDGAQLDKCNMRGAKLQGVDLAKAKNYAPATMATGTVGAALTELNLLVTQANEIRVAFRIASDSDREGDEVSINSQYLQHGWGLRVPKTLYASTITRQVRSFSDAMLHIANVTVNRKVRFETVEVKSTKSPKTGKALRDLVIAGIAEAFAQPVPPAAELAAATKAIRTTKTTQGAEARKQREEYKRRQEELKKRELKKIEKTIQKQVGQVTDIATFLKALELRADKSKIDKATKMLKAERFQLFNDITDTHLNGVVKSQTDADLVYACRIESNGHYACCTQNLNICGGLRGSICKHLLVLIVGLVKAGQLDPSTIDTWIAKTHDTKPELNKETMGEIFIRYKGAEAGEVDWRPTETVPEDYYAV